MRGTFWTVSLPGSGRFEYLLLVETFSSCAFSLRADSSRGREAFDDMRRVASPLVVSFE